MFEIYYETSPYGTRKDNEMLRFMLKSDSARRKGDPLCSIASINEAGIPGVAGPLFALTAAIMPAVRPSRQLAGQHRLRCVD